MEKYILDGGTISNWRNDWYCLYSEATYASLPHKFEAGTPNIVGAISLGYALPVQSIGMKNVESQ